VCIACELLDNLPHDKIRVMGGKICQQGEIIPSDQEASTNQNSQDSECNGDEMHQPRVPLDETFVPLSDPLLSLVLKLAPEYAMSSVLSWVPTVACGVLHRLHKERPNATLALADFDWLPTPDLTRAQGEKRISIWAAGEPIVTDMKGLDHPCYLLSPDHCDILFPTNFAHLASFVKRSWGIPAGNTSTFQVNVHKQSDFLEQFGPEQVQATKSWLTGFTPMLHDFGNCGALTVTRTEPDASAVSGPVGKQGMDKKLQIPKKHRL
jgi:Putative S-adenosyl-L-methionine-dependent methyltransferase